MRQLSTRFSVSNDVGFYPIAIGSVLHVVCDMEWTIEKTTLFIEDYHNSPELWNNKIAAYKDNRLKNDKLKQIATKYECTVIEVKNKIKNLRSAFHRERKKLQSKKSGSSPLTKGQWFAFELLSFLLDVDKHRRTTSTASDNGEESANEDDISVSNTQDTEAEVSNIEGHRSCEERRDIVIAPKKKTEKKKRFISPSDREEEAYNILKSSCQRDEFSTYGEHVGNELRHLSPRAQTIAKHLINNILYDASMGKFDDQTSTRTSTACETNESNYNQPCSVASASSHQSGFSDHSNIYVLPTDTLSSEPPSVSSACLRQSTSSESSNIYVQPSDNFGNNKEQDLSTFTVLSEFLVSKP
ncbi:unnamed protein product [Acanthoscelides obtectus]|uniref:MADF domain-containing protein n=1 Tax=Acanthoscelides obtectus TaxID=200917 RepID=A0A9P0MGP6_ACAOB|nr:unnamed protein product [Acanthoscelides obtectus]CAK1623161.1 hypothetical protein AOBTE_LOCUS1845 [Acanthoscelides obtectus]